MQNSKSRGFHVTAESLLSFPVGKTEEVSRSPDANSCLLQVVKVFSYRTSPSLLGTELHGTTLHGAFGPVWDLQGPLKGLASGPVLSAHWAQGFWRSTWRGGVHVASQNSLVIVLQLLIEGSACPIP